MADHYHYEYADERHSHSGYADERHDHDYDYAGKYHRHHDLEDLIEGLRADLNAAYERIAELEQAIREQATREHARRWADGTESHPGEESEGV